MDDLRVSSFLPLLCFTPASEVQNISLVTLVTNKFIHYPLHVSKSTFINHYLFKYV